MATSTPKNPVQPPPQSAGDALHNRDEFSLWAEAVRQQMLAALQKRQGRN